MSYVSEVLADSPFAYWKLDETVGTTAADSSGNSHPGTYNGGFTLNATSTAIGAAVSFDGSTGYMEVAGASPTTWSTTNYTLECWANFPNISTTGGEVHPIMVPSWSSGNIGGSLGYDLDASNTQRIQGGHFTSGAWQVAGDTVAPRSISTWYYLVITWDGTTLKLYLNATQVGGATPGVGTGAPTGFPAFRLARRWDSAGAEPFTGVTMQHAAVYSTPLTSTRIGVHYNAGVTTVSGTAAGSFGALHGTAAGTAIAIRRPLELGAVELGGTSIVALPMRNGTYLDGGTVAGRTDVSASVAGPYAAMIDPVAGGTMVIVAPNAGYLLGQAMVSGSTRVFLRPSAVTPDQDAPALSANDPIGLGAVLTGSYNTGEAEGA